MKRYGVILGACALVALVVLIALSGTRFQQDPNAALAGPPPTPDCSVTSWDWEGGNCFGLEGLWHHETAADVSGMSGGMLAFNQDCDGTGTLGCTYETGARVLGLATSPTFTAVNGAVLTFKTARWVELETSCATSLDRTTVRYSINGGASYLVMDLLATGSITPGEQVLAASGLICHRDLTAQTVKVKLPPGTTNIAFEFDSLDDQINEFAGQFIDDVVVSACSPPACPTQTGTSTPTPTITPTPPPPTAPATATGTPTVTPTITPTPKATPAAKPQPTAHSPEATASLWLDADCDSSTSETFAPRPADDSTFTVCVFGDVPLAAGYNLRFEWDDVALSFDDSLTPADYDFYVESCDPPLGAGLSALEPVTIVDFVVLRVEGAANSVTCPSPAKLVELVFSCNSLNNHGPTNVTMTGSGSDTYLIDADGPPFEIKPSLLPTTIFCLDTSLDSDNDGCKNGQEAGQDETIGGRRNPMNRWDFYDVAIGGAVKGQDRQVDLFNDIVSVIDHYAPAGIEKAYDAWFDRGPTAGPNPWNLTAPDGKIDLFNDIVGVINQFGHDCR